MYVTIKFKLRFFYRKRAVSWRQRMLRKQLYSRSQVCSWNFCRCQKKIGWKQHNSMSLLHNVSVPWKQSANIPELYALLSHFILRVSQINSKSPQKCICWFIAYSIITFSCMWEFHSAPGIVVMNVCSSKCWESALTIGSWHAEVVVSLVMENHLSEFTQG